MGEQNGGESPEFADLPDLPDGANLPDSQKKAIGCGIAILVVVVLGIIGAIWGGSDENNEPPDNVSPAVISRIESSTNCAALQSEFDTADVNGNADLMAFIDDHMRDVGCYG